MRARVSGDIAEGIIVAVSSRPGRVTYAEAAEILGVHFSAIAKMRRRGDLTTQRRRDGALLRADVEALAERRRAPRPARTTTRPAAPPDPGPDDVHDWLAPGEVALLAGVTPVAVRKRIRRGRLPAVTTLDGRHWVRRDHLELVERARRASRSRQA